MRATDKGESSIAVYDGSHVFSRSTPGLRPGLYAFARIRELAYSRCYPGFYAVARTSELEELTDRQPPIQSLDQFIDRVLRRIQHQSGPDHVAVQSAFTYQHSLTFRFFKDLQH